METGCIPAVLGGLEKVICAGQSSMCDTYISLLSPSPFTCGGETLPLGFSTKYRNNIYFHIWHSQAYFRNIFSILYCLFSVREYVWGYPSVTVEVQGPLAGVTSFLWPHGSQGFEFIFSGLAAIAFTG